MAEYDARYLKGIEYFNECEFYEAHDVWEELWALPHDRNRERFMAGHQNPSSSSMTPLKEPPAPPSLDLLGTVDHHEVVVTSCVA